MRLQPLFFVLIAALVAGQVQNQAAGLRDGLLSHWPFESDNGGTTSDAIFSNHFTLNGASVFEPGKIGNALTLDGSTSYLSLYHTPDNTETGLPIYRAGAYSISMWVKGPAQTGKYLFSEGNTTDNDTLLILQTGQAPANNSKFDVVLRTDGGGTLVNHVVSTAVVFDDTWHHVVWVDNRGDAKLYVDGVLDSANFRYTPAGTFTFDTTAVGTLIRALVSNNAIFQGQIDELALWERALSDAEVQELFTNGVPSGGEISAPSIVTQPSSATKRIGDWHLLSVEALGQRPLTFQWFKNGNLIPEGTSSSYRVVNLTMANSGEVYTVKVSNAGGEITSTEAVITVIPDSDADVRNGLINYWPLNEIVQDGANLTSPDLYSGNDMVLVDFAGTTDTIPGAVENALFFDGIKYAYRTNGSPIYNNTNFSVAMWVKAPYELQRNRRVFSEGSSVSNNPLFTVGTDDTGNSPSATVFVRDGAGANAAIVGRKSTRPVFDDTWHHIVWTDENGQGKLYVDGVLDETDYSYVRRALTLDRTSLGAVLRAAVSDHIYGAVDEVATWNRVLSWTEIQSILTNGIPAPLAAVPPTITAQPSAPSQRVYSGDNISLTVQVSGTLPITYQWRKNGTEISASANPSAATDTLVLSNVQESDSGAYSVVVSNNGGTLTSEPAELLVRPYTPATFGEVLKIDVGVSGGSNLQPGFSEFHTGLNGTDYNGIKVTVSGIGAALASRNRTSGATVVNNPPALTQGQIYNDFIFANSAVDGNGMRILIERLAPNTPYHLTLWSFDPQSTGTRISDWSETSTETPVVLQEGYTFNGSERPQNDFENTIQAVVTSSPSGRLQLEGRRNGGSSVAVFFNGLRLIANPGATPIQITQTQVVNGKIRLTIEKQTADQNIEIQQTTDVTGGSWVTAADGAVVETVDKTVTAQFNLSSEHMFYRVVGN